MVIEVLRPALAAREIILCDRFTDSTIAYQGYGRGVPRPAIRAINHFATEELAPDLTILLDLDAAAGLARLQGRVLDSFEKLDLPFHERVRTGYLELAADEPDRFAVIDAAQAPDDVRNAIQMAVTRLGL